MFFFNIGVILVKLYYKIKTVSGEILKIKDLFPDQSDSPFDKNTWRRVREQGRLLMDDKDDGPVRGWGLFQEYARRCEVAVYKDDLGHRQMVIVDPEVGSRRDRYVSCQDQFRKTFLLFLNLAEAKRHSLGDPDAAISVRDLERIYPGMTMGQLGGMLRERLSSIRYGKIFCEKKPRIDVDSVGGGVKRGGGGEMAVVANNTADIRAEKRKKRSRGTIIRVVAAAGVVSVVTSACARAIVPLPTSAETTAPISSTVPATDPGETIEPRVTPTEFSPQVTPTYAVEAAGGPYTEVQLALNNSQSAINQKVIIERWLAYWANFDNRPFDPTSVQLKWKYIYDSNNPANVLVMLEAGGEYNGRLFMGPIGADGKFAEFPPEVSGQDIQPGFGPLELSAGGEGMWLSVNENGIPVRRDGTGTIVQTLNMETRQWEVVDSRWETPDASLAEQIKSVMPAMWVYDHESKTFIERPVDDLTFSIFERTTLYIYDKDGNEVGFARYFLKSTLDSENTEYYSLTDESVDSLIPVKLYAQMGDFDIDKVYGIDTNQCMYAFSEDMATFPGPFNQSLIDDTNKYALDIAQISSGEEMMQAALIRTVAMIKGVSEDQIKLDLKNGTSVVISINGQDWEVNKGVDFIWDESHLNGVEVVDGKLVSYDGTASSISNCSNLSIGNGLYRALYKSFGVEVMYAFGAGVNPILSIYEGRTSVVTTLRR